MQQATDFNQQANASLISYTQFVHEVAKLAGVSETSMMSALESNVPNEPLFEYIQKLKSQYKIGLLSNTAQNWLEEIFSKQQIALFDSLTLSYETGIAKPDARIYEIASKKLEVEPAECVFIDDQARYCDAARAVGMEAVCYQDFQQFKAELEQILSR